MGEGSPNSQLADTNQCCGQIWDSSADPTDAPNPWDQVSGAVAWDLPSTRARGWDEVSAKQTSPPNKSVHVAKRERESD